MPGKIPHSIQSPQNNGDPWSSITSADLPQTIKNLYHGEIEDVWLQRLDTTTYLAAFLTGLTLLLSFASPNIHHGYIILNVLLITGVHFIEARRYRDYQMLKYRVRLMEIAQHLPDLPGRFHQSPDLAAYLAENLLRPIYPISLLQAFGNRLRNYYLWIYIILGISWLTKGYLFPQQTTNVLEFIYRYAIGAIPGLAIIILGTIYYGILLWIAIGTIHKTEVTDEMLQDLGGQSYT